jgi:hypothetical protein
MQLDAAKVCDPQQRCDVADRREPDRAAGSFRFDLECGHPLGCVGRSIFLVPIGTCNPFWLVFQSQRPFLDVRNEVGRNIEVIGEQVAFRVADLRPEDLFKVCEPKFHTVGACDPMITQVHVAEHPRYPVGLVILVGPLG